MKTTIFQKLNWSNAIAYMILLSILAFLIYGFYIINKKGVNGHAVVITGGDNRTLGKDDLLYIVNNKPYYFISVRAGFAKLGDCFEVSYLEDDPEWADLEDRCDTSVFKGKIIIHGDDYPDEKWQEVKVYDDSLVVKSLKFMESFAMVIDNKSRIRIEYIVDGKVLDESSYSFYKSPLQKIIRMDYGDIEDEINQ